MAKAFQCDVCGEVFSGYSMKELAFDVITHTGRKLTTVLTITNGIYSENSDFSMVGSSDVCPRCYEKVALGHRKFD